MRSRNKKVCGVGVNDALEAELAKLRDRLDVMTQCADNYSRMFEESAEELDAAREILAQQGRRNTELRAERDTLRQQLAERDVVAAVTGEDEMLSDVLADIATHDKKIKIVLDSLLKRCIMNQSARR